MFPWRVTVEQTGTLPQLKAISSRYSEFIKRRRKKADAKHRREPSWYKSQLSVDLL
jgi:hypothetical protein